MAEVAVLADEQRRNEVRDAAGNPGIDSDRAVNGVIGFRRFLESCLRIDRPAVGVDRFRFRAEAHEARSGPVDPDLAGRAKRMRNVRSSVLAKGVSLV